MGKPQFTPEGLNKALAEFEEKLAKGGDALQNQPHDGGLATQGTNIQTKADAKKAVEKALEAQGLSKANADKLLKMLSASDMESEDGDDESPDASSPMDSEDDDENDALDKAKTKKSTTSDLRKALVDADARNEEAFDIAPFLETFVGKFDHMNKSTNARVDSLSKALTEAQKSSVDFNARLAKGLVLLISNVNDRFDAVQKSIEAIAAQPVPNTSRGNIRKSEIQQPQFNNGSFDDNINGPNTALDLSVAKLRGVEYMKVQKALADYAMAGHCDPLEVIKFENTRGDYSQLPPAIVNKLAQELCPTA